MKNIERRAQLYTDAIYDGIPFESVNHNYDIVYDAYVAGATKQLEIDNSERNAAIYYILDKRLDTLKESWINKICEVFKDFMRVQYGEDIDESMEMYLRNTIIKATE